MHRQIHRIRNLFTTLAFMVSISCMQAEKVSLDTSGAQGLLLGSLSLDLGLFGGGSGGEGGTPQTISGTVTGLLSSSTISIQNAGGETIDISANGSFNFTTPTYNYSVTITAQPSSLRCIVLNGSGAATGPVSNIIVTCPMAVQNGLIWMRCSHGQTWAAATGTCTGSATTVQFCSDYCHDGNGAGEAGNVNGHLNGNGTSQAFSACNSLNTTNGGAGAFGINNWRVPWKTELKALVYCSNGTPTPLADFSNCGAGYSIPTINTALFPGTMAGVNERYWSSSASYSLPGVRAYSVSFETGATSDGYNQSNLYHLRCVAE